MAAGDPDNPQRRNSQSTPTPRPTSDAVPQIASSELVKMEVNQAEAAALAENFEKARGHMTRAIDAEPKNAKLHALMGHYTSRCKQLPEAERNRLSQYHLEYAIELNAKEPLGHFYLGLMHWGRGDRIRARAAWQAALTANPEFKPAFDALERRTTAVQVAVAEPTSPKRVWRGPSRKLIALGVVVVLLAGGTALFGILRPNAEYTKFGAMLGSRLKIHAAHAGRTELHLDVGSSWKKLSDPERALEAKTLAENAARLGFAKVVVHAKGASERPRKIADGAELELVDDSAY